MLALVLRGPLEPPDSTLAVTDTLDDALLVPPLSLLGGFGFLLELGNLLLLGSLDLVLRILRFPLEVLLVRLQLLVVLLLNDRFLLLKLVTIAGCADTLLDLFLAFLRIHVHPFLDLVHLGGHFLLLGLLLPL